MSSITQEKQSPYKGLVRGSVPESVLRETRLNIAPYANTADQEFALKSALDKRRTNEYEDWADVYCLWGQNSNKIPCKITLNDKLEDAIRIRADGFILNMTTGMVLYADKKSADVVKGLLGTPLNELKEKHQDVFDALRIGV